MCLFDKEPAWKLYLQDGEFYDKECKGEAENWYYIILFIIHWYMLLEFVLRVITQKYIFKFLLCSDSFIELLTTVPFIILYLSVGTKDRTF